MKVGKLVRMVLPGIMVCLMLIGYATYTGKQREELQPSQIDAGGEGLSLASGGVRILASSKYLGSNERKSSNRSIEREKEEFVQKVEAETIEESVRNLLHNPVNLFFAMDSHRANLFTLHASLQRFSQDPRTQKLLAVAYEGTEREKERLLNAIMAGYDEMLRDVDSDSQARLAYMPNAGKLYPVLAALVDTEAKSLSKLTELFQRVENTDTPTKQVQCYGAQLLLDRIVASPELRRGFTNDQRAALREYAEWSDPEQTRPGGWAAPQVFGYAARVVNL